VAHGIVEIANSAMTGAIRRISVQRGYDPREFSLVSFGGAGPLHANRLADALDIGQILIPMSPGIFSAMGLLATDLKHDYSTTHVSRLEEVNFDSLTAEFAKLTERGRQALTRENVTESQMQFIRHFDLRYVGQSYELSLLAPSDIDANQLQRLSEQFHAEHERAYGFSAVDEPIQLVNLRLTATGEIAKPRLRRLREGSGGVPISSRRVYFAETEGFVDCPVFDRYSLGAGDHLVGPAIVAELDSTTLIHPGFAASVDEFGNLLIERVQSAA